MAKYQDMIYKEDDTTRTAEANKVQRALYSMGYYGGTMDSTFNADTNAAVANFAKDYGLNYDGTINEDLYSAMTQEAVKRGADNTRSATVNGYTTPQAVGTNNTTGGYSAMYADAEKYRDKAYQIAGNYRSAAYNTAAETRQEAEKLAEIQRKRGIVDSNTLYQQQRATYGANAESLGRIGLNVSGYSDYINSQAYASGMAYRQAANAQATDALRQASYQEAIARLDADKAYNTAIADAEKTYYGAMSDIRLREQEAKDAKVAAQEKGYAGLVSDILNGVINVSDGDFEKVAKAYGVTDATMLKDAKNLYNDKNVNTDNVVSYEAQGNYVEAAKNLYPNNPTEQAQYIVGKAAEDDDMSIIANLGTWEDIEKTYGAGAYVIKKAYNDYYKTLTSGYFDTLTPYEVSEFYNNINFELLDKETADLIRSEKAKYDNNKKGLDAGDYGYIVNLYKTSADDQPFGEYSGGDDSEDEQYQYTDAIIKFFTGDTSVKMYTGDGKEVTYDNIQVGDCIYVNVGYDNYEDDVYEYIGNGEFKKIDDADTEEKRILVPAGYKFKHGDIVKED